MNELNTAQLAIYCALAIPVLYIWFRHGSPGFLGFLYLFAFCMLKVVGAAMLLSAEDSGTTNSGAETISSVGLSPLLLCTLGVLHEARTYRHPARNPAFEWMLIAMYHFGIMTAIGLVATGASGLASTDPKSIDAVLLKIGIILILIGWVVLVGGAIFSAGPSQYSAKVLGFDGGSMLLRGVILSLPFTLLRLIFSTVSIFTQSPHWNPLTGDIGFRVALMFLPELCTTLIFIYVGFSTHTLRRDTKGVNMKVTESRTHSGHGRGSSYV